MYDDTAVHPTLNQGPARDARTLYCLLASYEVYGLSHGWPPCLGATCIMEEHS